MSVAPPAARLALLRWRPFRLPLRHRFESATGVLVAREGVLVELHDTDGASGIGEASPTASLGGGERVDVLRLLARHAAALLAAGDAAASAVADGPGAAALRCALDTALLDLAARRRDLPVAALLAERPASSVLVNAVIGGGTAEEVAAHARAATAAGYGVLKLKVGTSDLGHDIDTVAAVRAACPGATLRLDANGAWDEHTATQAMRRLALFGVELLEQPVPAAEVEALARLRVSAPLRIAADEAIASEAGADRVLALRAADLLVLKPMLLGGPRPALALAQRAAQRGIGSFATTSFDSSVGTAAALHLAAALPWDAAQGLGTGDHLAADLVVEPLRPAGGRLAVRGPGLGVELDAGALDALATAPWSEVRA
ncbi:MAG: o-succinylbenzoate synthase [Dehalococcoidia bacterium]|nr:o-succinylbenzoate synthase [Dehalococcoidia bacterium]